MATLPSVTPSYGAQKQSAPRIKTSRFNDGYMHRIKFGMNIDAKTWNLSWSNLTETNSDILETFFQDRADDGASFDWTPPDTGVSYKWICLTWSKNIPYNNRANIQATFEQVYEP